MNESPPTERKDNAARAARGAVHNLKRRRVGIRYSFANCRAAAIGKMPGCRNSVGVARYLITSGKLMSPMRN
jgi:hypothetical protein